VVAPAMFDKARDLGFEITGQTIVLEQNTVLERLVPAPCWSDLWDPQGFPIALAETNDQRALTFLKRCNGFPGS
jgi:hypothetical protein